MRAGKNKGRLIFHVCSLGECFPTHLFQQGSPVLGTELQESKSPPHPQAAVQWTQLSACKCFGPTMNGAVLSSHKAYDAAESKKKKRKLLYNQSFLSRKRPHGSFFPFSQNLYFLILRFRIENWFLFILPVYRFSLSSGTSICFLALPFVLQLSKICHTLFSD